MKRKIFTISLILVLIGNQSISQTKIYLDENLNEIDSVQYLNKCQYNTLKCLEYKKDSLSINKLMFLHSFGNINKTQNNQIRSILTKDSGEIIDNNSIIIIRYIDSLFSYSTIQRKHTRHIKSHKNSIDSINKKPTIIRHRKLNSKIYNKNNEKWLKTQKKCIKTFEKIDNVKVLYVYNNSQINIDFLSSINPIKDRNVLKNTFFKILYQYRSLILKPNGEYFLSGGHLSDKKIKELIKEKDWNNLIEDWKITIQKYPRSGQGFFKSTNKHEKHCF